MMTAIQSPLLRHVQMRKKGKNGTFFYHAFSQELDNVRPFGNLEETRCPRNGRTKPVTGPIQECPMSHRTRTRRLRRHAHVDLADIIRSTAAAV
jgi:hypothetical protein